MKEYREASGVLGEQSDTFVYGRALLRFKDIYLRGIVVQRQYPAPVKGILLSHSAVVLAKTRTKRVLGPDQTLGWRWRCGRIRRQMAAIGRSTRVETKR